MEHGAAAQKIVEASWRAIARAGVRKFRVSDVASDAGVSVGLVYYHFTDRNGLLRATMEYANRMAFVAESTSEGEPPAVSGFEQLSALLFTDMAGTDTSRDNAVVWYEIVGRRSSRTRSGGRWLRRSRTGSSTSSGPSGRGRATVRFGPMRMR
ncbi:TetR family transcriptional regulator [Leucobacter soli]|uniref:TetR family transcriptional regulator n=1 Tax=Leucobacter soli TaxID=2812850 RepID=UPI00361944FC